MTPDQAKRFVRLREWALALTDDPLDERFFLNEGYGPLDRLDKFEAVYASWVAEHPEDALEDFRPRGDDDEESGLI